MLNDQQFRLKADEALEKLYKALTSLADEHDFETDLGGTLTIEFDNPPAKFVVSPNGPVSQIWVSALSKSYKLSWDAQKGTFVLPDTGQTLDQVVLDAINTHLGKSIQL